MLFTSNEPERDVNRRVDLMIRLIECGVSSLHLNNMWTDILILHGEMLLNDAMTVDMALTYLSILSYTGYPTGFTSDGTISPRNSRSQSGPLPPVNLRS